MAYFGRTPKKPGSKPGSQSGTTRADRAVLRLARDIRQEIDRERQGRPVRAGRAVRNVRAARSGRSSR